MFGAAGAASATTYSFTGPTYTSVIDATACTVGPCANYTTAMQVTGSFTTSAPLAANLSNANVYGLITAYSFTDGINTWTKSTGPADNNRLVYLGVSTDASGNIIAASTNFDAYLWLSADHTTTGRVSFLAGNLNQPRHNLRCGAVGTGADGNTDDCVSPTADTVNGSSASAGLGVWTTVVPAPVPTMSEWAMILFGLILAGGAALYIQRRQFAA